MSLTFTIPILFYICEDCGNEDVAYCDFNEMHHCEDCGTVVYGRFCSEAKVEVVIDGSN